MSNKMKQRAAAKNAKTPIKSKQASAPARLIDEYPKRIKDAKKFTYEFWTNKPVPQFDEISIMSTPIEQNLLTREVYKSDNPIKLPDGLRWVTIDMSDTNMLASVCQFLRLHYLIDQKNKFRIDYTPDFLRFAIGKNGMMIAIVSQKSNVICGLVATSFKLLTVFDKLERFAAVDFLCSHPIYRKKKIAFTLIDEIVRRITKTGCHFGCFTTERCIPTPTTTIRYYHRPINYSKLQKHGFIEIGGNPEKVQLKFNLSDNVSNDFIKMKNEDLTTVYELYKYFSSRFNIYCHYTEQELGQLLLNNDFVNSYVVMDGEKIVDFASYYKLPYLIENSEEKINSAYMFLYSCTTVSPDTIIDNLLKIAKKENYDVLNVLDVGLVGDMLLTSELNNGDESDEESYEHVYEHKFLKGTGKIYFNFFNWKCPEIRPRQLLWTVY